MPRRPLCRVAFSIGLAVVLFSAFSPASGQPREAFATPESPSALPRVRIEPRNDSAIEGRLKAPAAVTLRTEIGTATIEFSHVRRIRFQKDDQGTSHDLVQLTDQSFVRGVVLDQQWAIEHDGGGKTEMSSETIREIQVLREGKLPLVAILLGLLTLAAMEIILGVDNIVFLAIIAGRLPEAQRPRARRIGLVAALGTRLLLLFSLSFLLGLTSPVFTLPTFGILQDIEAREVSWRDIILLAGGLFLIAKSTFEMHEKLEHAKRERASQAPAAVTKSASFAWTIFTIAVIDIVFSFDSVITAIGMVEELWVMVVAMVIAMLVMLYFAGPIATFVDRHPTIKVLALAFLILIGVLLVAEGLGQHIDKGYIYSAMAFSVVVEMINMKLRKPPRTKAEPAAA
ncbi:MAG TPA: TerC family protein [Gemmata sp.]|nr:TerC family protein [Gemmata sp.]